MQTVVKNVMRASEFLPEKINYDNMKPGMVHQKELMGGKYYITAIAKKDTKHPGLVVYITDHNDISKLSSLQAIAYGRFIPKGDDLEVSFVQVHDQYQRKGFASAMYNYIRSLGNDIVPSKAQSPDAKAFWKAGAGINRDLKNEPEPEQQKIPEPEVKRKSFTDKLRSIFA